MYHIKTTLQDHTGLQKERKTMQNQTKPHENYTKISQKLCKTTRKLRKTTQNQELREIETMHNHAQPCETM